MQRWHVTVGLCGLVVASAVLAPRLYPDGGYIPIHEPPAPPNPLLVPEVAPVPTSGHLMLDVGLDRTLLVAGQTSDRYVVITLTAPAAPTTAAPVDVAVVLDTSGSMTRDGAIDHAKQAARTVVDGLRPSDWFTLVTFDDLAETRVPNGPVNREAAWLAISRISEGGTTNLYGGLERARAELQQSPMGDNARPQRILLLSDGKPTAGVLDDASIERFAASLQAQGITVSTLGLGPEYNEDLLAHIADLGGGSWHHVGRAADLETSLGEAIRQTTATVADATRVQIHLPTGVTGVDVLGWDATPTSDGWSVPVGQIHGGETRKIVAKVRVNAGFTGSPPIATVTADWLDRLDDAPGHAEDAVTSSITTDAWAAENSRDAGRARMAVEAESGVLLRRSAESYASGNVTEAIDLAGRAADGVGAIPEMSDEARNIRQQLQWYGSARPESDEGQQAIKHNKHTYRGLVREGGLR